MKDVNVPEYLEPRRCSLSPLSFLYQIELGGIDWVFGSRGSFGNMSREILTLSRRRRRPPGGSNISSESWRMCGS